MNTPKSTRSELLRTLLFLVSVALIVYFLPRSDKDRFVYEVNRPWSYALFTAPFDIPEHLDSVSASRLKDSIDARFEPVFKRDAAMEKTIISDYTTRLNSTPDLDITPAQKNQIIKAIRAVYDDGIVDRDVYARITSGDLPAVRFVNDNVAISVPTSRFLSAFRAYEHLDSVLRDKNIHGALTATKLSEMLRPNISLDSVRTRSLLEDAYQKALAPVGVVQQGERIIDKGDIVTSRIATILQTYEEMAEERGHEGQLTQHHYPVAGQILYVMIVIASLYAYLKIFRPKFFEDDRTVLFLVSLTTLFTLFAFAMGATFASGYYITPFSMVPILVVIFLDSRTAYFVHLTVVLLCAIVASFPLEFFFMQIIAGVVAIDSLKDLSRRSQLIRTAALIFIAYALCYVSVEVMQTGTISKTEPRIFGAFAVNAILISFSYVLMFLLERIFGYTSKVTLVELSDTNNPLLRELSEECPGTFNHSMAVSNLASAAAQRIGANVQMVRTGALYHDIGKIRNPAFFTENQHGVNPHDALDPIQSARIVTGHVRDGLIMADKAKLPQAIKDFIAQHHGTGKARYFYTTYLNAHPGETVDPTPFTYPGPNPQSRETSLLMMADAVEAASRSMKDHTPEAITALVNKIIDGQIAEGLHNESPISFRDVNAVKDVFAQRLRTMYHSRISYPELKNQEGKTEKETAPKAQK
ncbi:MAG: HDIG domain-containing protein [Muribaculaceae bacterium]|nr:HDIG domain-containing protein [Muribaculaceae bacterium]